MLLEWIEISLHARNTFPLSMNTFSIQVTGCLQTCSGWCCMIRFPVYNFIVYWTFPVPFQLMVGLSTGRIVNIFHEQYWTDNCCNILTLVYTINYYDGALRDFVSLIFEAILEYLTVIQKFLHFCKTIHSFLLQCLSHL